MSAKNPSPGNFPVLIYGGDELVSAGALKLVRSGIYPVMLVREQTRYLRHHLCFGEALVKERVVVEEVPAAQLPEQQMPRPEDRSPDEHLLSVLSEQAKNREIPVLTHLDIEQACAWLQPQVLWLSAEIEADPRWMDLADLVVGLYPAHHPGQHCHLAIETRWNYQLGRVYQPGSQPIAQKEKDPHYFKFPFSLCPAPIEGLWIALKEIGQPVRFQEPLGTVQGIEIRCPLNGQIWGLTHSGRFVAQKEPIALIFQGPPTEDFRSFGFREHAIAGGLLEATFRRLSARQQ